MGSLPPQERAHSVIPPGSRIHTPTSRNLSTNKRNVMKIWHLIVILALIFAAYTVVKNRKAILAKF